MSLFITKILFQDDLNYLPFFVALKDKEHRAQAWLYENQNYLQPEFSNVNRKGFTSHDRCKSMSAIVKA